MSAGMRLPAQPGEVIDRSSSIGFTWNGTALTGLDGDTIASALMANGVRVVSRSMKYHRPRGVHDRGLLGPQRLRPGRRRPQRALRAPAAGASHGRVGPERLAVARPRHQGGQWPRRPVPERRLLLQDLHPTPAAVADLRAGAGHVRPGRQGRSRHPTRLLRQALRPPRRGGGRRRPGRHGRRGRGGRGRCVGHAGRAWSPAGWAPAVGRRRRSGPGRRVGGRGRGSRRRGADRLDRDRSLRRQLDRHRAAQPPVGGGTAHQGPGQDAGGGAGADRATIRVRRQRQAGRDALRRGPPPRQPPRHQAGGAGGGLHRQRRRRRGGRRPGTGRGRGGPDRRRPQGREPRLGPGSGAVGALGRTGRRFVGRCRPARHRGRLDRADLAAQHGRRPTGLRPDDLPVPPRSPYRHRARHRRTGR